MDRAGVERPTRVGGRTVLEADSPVVWHTFPGARHDIGRFHTPEGALTGFYANILTPVEFLPPAPDGADVWRTTDLFLDVFLTPAGDVHLLDRDELDAAVGRKWLSEAEAAGAIREAERLVERARAGEWPPPIVTQWTVGRAREVAGTASRAHRGGRGCTEAGRSQSDSEAG